MSHQPITVAEILTLTRQTLRLGEIERVPTHPDGLRHETDSTHSVMLALVSAVAASRMGLDPGRAALLALLHDMPEVYAGDTDTSLGLSEAAQQDKDQREFKATLQLNREWDTLPLLYGLLADYQRGLSAEAQVVGLMDKALPKAVRVVGRQVTGGSGQQQAAQSQASRLREKYSAPGLEPLHQVSAELRALLFGADPTFTSNTSSLVEPIEQLPPVEVVWRLLTTQERLVREAGQWRLTNRTAQALGFLPDDQVEAMVNTRVLRIDGASALPTATTHDQYHKGGKRSVTRWVLRAVKAGWKARAAIAPAGS